MDPLRLFTVTGPLQQHDGERLLQPITTMKHQNPGADSGRHCTPSFYARLSAQGREQREGTAWRSCFCADWPGRSKEEDWDEAPALARIKPLKSRLHGVIGELADLSSHEQSPDRPNCRPE